GVEGGEVAVHYRGHTVEGAVLVDVDHLCDCPGPDRGLVHPGPPTAVRVPGVRVGVGAPRGACASGGGDGVIGCGVHGPVVPFWRVTGVWGHPPNAPTRVMAQPTPTSPP